MFTRPDSIRIATQALRARQQGRLARVSWQGHAALMKPAEAFIIAILVENAEDPPETLP